MRPANCPNWRLSSRLWLSSRIWTNQRWGLWSRDLPPPITAHLDVGEAAECRLVQGGHLVVLQPQYLQVGQLRQRGVVNLKSNQIFLVHQMFSQSNSPPWAGCGWGRGSGGWSGQPRGRARARGRWSCGWRLAAGSGAGPTPRALRSHMEAMLEEAWKICLLVFYHHWKCMITKAS